MVPWESFFCITIWLPRRRTSMNPCLERMEHTCSPERLPSLPKSHLDLSYKYLAVKTLGNLFR
jgi:hypothetical protein